MKAMKSKTSDRDKSTWLAAGLGLAVLVSLNDAQAQEKNNKKDKRAKPAAGASQQQRPVQQQPSQEQRVHEPRQEQPRQNPNRVAQQSQAERRREMNRQTAQHQNTKLPESNPRQI